MAKKQYHHASHSKYLLKYHFVFCCKYRKKCFRSPETLSPTDIATRLKGQSTYHIWRTQQEYLQWMFWKENTFWSDGYFVCTTGDASTDTIRTYIEEQG